ncbi:hypothetical protein AcW2_007254 [Taiwanofungus camphoratus]|nr:hypothetical protein AcW2_007254 [Antrodia cinnamomea]
MLRITTPVWPLAKRFTQTSIIKVKMASSLAPTICQGILNLPGATHESKATAERLLEHDRQRHHCFFGKIGLHNHLSHHLLAAYDLGAPAKLLQAIYDQDAPTQSPIHLANRKDHVVEEQHVTVTSHNWTEYLGKEKYYANLLAFFTSEIRNLGSGEVLEKYVFAPSANGNGAHMLLRFVGGAVHPLIQTGYAVEFGSDAMLAQALAQTAVHQPFAPELFDLSVQEEFADGSPAAYKPKHRQPSRGRSLLAILREAYDSRIMEPVMPYDPDALLRVRIRDALYDGRDRPAEIRRLSAQWQIDTARRQQELDDKVEELLWTTALLLAGTGKPGRAARLAPGLLLDAHAECVVLPAVAPPRDPDDGVEGDTTARDRTCAINVPHHPRAPAHQPGPAHVIHGHTEPARGSLQREASAGRLCYRRSTGPRLLRSLACNRGLRPARARSPHPQGHPGAVLRCAEVWVHAAGRNDRRI